MDRNYGIGDGLFAQVVALRKESVDRNYVFPGGAVIITKSLSARRAWIEIHVSS